MSFQPLHFYQTGTFTVGNRLLSDKDRTVQADIGRTNSLNSGHRACQGCGEALGARFAIDAAMNAARGRLIAANATGCLEVFSTPYPETSWQIPWIHSLFGNTAAVATGIGLGVRSAAMAGLQYAQRKTHQQQQDLIAQIAGLLKSPIQRLAGVLAALAEQKGGGAAAEAAPQAAPAA